jgi:glycosyltransferase involved in cell wall biosynthesis
MSAPMPFVSVVVETSTWQEPCDIDLADALHSLHEQTYPRDRFEIVVVLQPQDERRWEPLGRRFHSVKVLRAPAELCYYQLKRYGMLHTLGDVVALVDADNTVSASWLEELLRPFSSDTSIAVVRGATHYRRAFLSRMWDAIWWPGTYEPEGFVDRLYANNAAYRRHALDALVYDDPSRYRGLWERVMQDRLRAAGERIWLNPRAVMVHHYEPTLSHVVDMAVLRGYQLLEVRFRAPRGAERALLRLGLALPWVVFPGLVLKDVWRIVYGAPRAGLGWWEAWKLPLYVLAYLPFELAVLAGMVRAAARRPPPRVP